jgi:hypothetical protein
LTEDALVDLIDGALSPADAARVRSVVARDPKLDRLVTGMMADRAMLTALPRDASPDPGLIATAQARYERERRGDELLRLAGSVGNPDDAAVPQRAAGFTARRVAPVWRTAGMGLAAAVVLAIGAGVAVVGWRVFAPRAAPVPGVAAQDLLPLETTSRVATTESRPDGPTSETADGTEGHSTATAPAVALLREAALGDAPRLAREQRLLVHVVAMDAGRVARAMTDTAPTARFRITPDADPLARLALLGGGSPGREDGRGLVSRVARELPGPSVAWVERAAGVAPRGPGAWRVRTDAWSARLVADDRGIAAMVTALERAGARVMLVELDEPMPEALDLSDDAAMWWSEPARDWPVRCVVPVLVDDLDLD